MVVHSQANRVISRVLLLLFACLRLLLRDSVSRCTEKSEVDCICHCFVSRFVWMEIIAGLISISKFRRLSWIAHRRVKVDDPVESASGPNPLVDTLPDLLAILAEIVRSSVGRQCCAINSDLMLVRSIHNLLHPGNQFRRGYALCCKRARRCGRSVL